MVGDFRTEVSLEVLRTSAYVSSVVRRIIHSMIVHYGLFSLVLFTLKNWEEAPRIAEGKFLRLFTLRESILLQRALRGLPDGRV